jgi:glycogen operon protein
MLLPSWSPLVSRALSWALVLGFLGCSRNGGGCVQETTSLYETADLGPGLKESDVQALKHLGPTLLETGINFGVYSERAERIEILLFDDPDSEFPIQQFPLTRFGDVWNLFVEGIGAGQAYGYVAWGPNWPYDKEFRPGSQVGFLTDVDAEGNRFNPNKLLTDPYALVQHRDHDWSRGSLGTGESRRGESTWGAAGKSLVMRSEHTWSEGESAWVTARKAGEGTALNELVIYEVHPKGFTANGLPEVNHPGTYAGIAEMADYLADLGITAVELLPIHEKPLDGGYWGYNPISWFAPELTYSTAFNDRGRPEEVLDEFKAMVETLHAAGIEVLIDVVYNHSGEGGLWREKLVYNDTSLDPDATAQAVNLDSEEVVGLYNVRGLDNAAFYALGEGGRTYWNNTGVGNQMRPNHLPMRTLILDSLHFMVEELHIDGFRFDLAGILGEQDGNYNEWYPVVRDSVLGDIVDDPVLQEFGVRLIAEPWTAGGHYNPVLGAYPAAQSLDGYAWGEWNAHFRDIVRGLLNEDAALNHVEGPVDAGGALTGSFNLYAWNGRRPAHSVNFITSHDGFTLYDLFSFDEKQNGCGVLNPLCCDEPYSQWCDVESGEDNNRSRDWGGGNEGFKRQQMRNAFALLLLSHGTPMILGGDEWMRTQYGNNNAYSNQADNEFNWFRWGEWRANDARLRMHDFVRDLIALRLSRTDAFSPEAYGEGMPFAWKNENNAEPVDWGARRLMVHYYDDGQGWGPELVLLLNFQDGPVPFTLPGDRNWVRVLDTQQYFDFGDGSGETGYFSDNPTADREGSANIMLEGGDAVPDGVYEVPGRTIVVLEDVEAE